MLGLLQSKLTRFSMISKTELLETSLTFLKQVFIVYDSFLSLFLIFLEQHFIRVFFFPETCHKGVQSNDPISCGSISLAKYYPSENSKLHQQNERKKCSILLHFLFYVKINKSLNINFSIFLYFLIIRTKKYPSKHKHTNIHILSLSLPVLFLWKTKFLKIHKYVDDT